MKWTDEIGGNEVKNFKGQEETHGMPCNRENNCFETSVSPASLLCGFLRSAPRLPSRASSIASAVLLNLPHVPGLMGLKEDLRCGKRPHIVDLTVKAA